MLRWVHLEQFSHVEEHRGLLKVGENFTPVEEEDDLVQQVETLGIFDTGVFQTLVAKDFSLLHEGVFG